MSFCSYLLSYVFSCLKIFSPSSVSPPLPVTIKCFQLSDIIPSSKMSSAIERPFIETFEPDHTMIGRWGFLSIGMNSHQELSKCLIGHRSADHRYRKVLLADTIENSVRFSWR
ncbi:hypothetical protein AVEN_137754-1 [Araneus ventricosus]|uniref:Uncharacterized protein n=1 Tax=Araneus ventricosus TaxID=182803 RepID=A0A4Y2WX60_ARAVE|nr:hypothetical protein AVEN_137754-1 [Araneus ventricosus]